MNRIWIGKRTTALLLCLWIFLLQGGCAHREEVPVGAVLSRLLLCEGDCPSGRIYQSTAEEGESGYFSESLCAALYGDGAVPAGWGAVEEFAIFLSAAGAPVEIAVFRATSGMGAKEIAGFCTRRSALLLRHYRGSEYEGYAAGGRVVILGRHVLMCISRNAGAAVEEARRMLKGQV